MRRTLVLALLAPVMASAAVIAILQSQRMVTTVTGMTAWECTYSAMGQTFRQVMPPGQMCPPTLMVQ